MGCENLPIQVIVYCDAGGGLKPLRFQYEDKRRQLHTVHVDQVEDSRKVAFLGSEAILYLCRAQEHLYELKYTIHTHKWVLFRQIC